jgi:hypothetical protein
MPPVIKDYEPYFEANEGKISKNKLYDISTVINESELQKENATIQMIELMTLKEYVQHISGEELSSYHKYLPDDFSG